ncbi:SH3 domain-containing protein [Antarctobacter jejuensis]|uniref:SH3 domain-containing protein n=1 Tax=Antarctobacter jejuensis TaxID=1439938 RepID=UPI003FD4A914
MRTAAVLASLTAALGLSVFSPARAQGQEFVGFDRSSFGKVVLSRNQAAGGGSDITLELAVGEYNNEPILNYSENSVFSKMGLAVGRLDILTDTGVYPCTAFIVDEKHILTNHHCVPGILDNERAGATRIDSVMFIAGYRQTGVDAGTRRYTVIPTPVETSKALDYAVLEVIGDPSADFGKLELTAVQPRDNDPYWVIGHPMGEAQRISREKCRANSPALSNKQLLHTCDTLPGNSGSPVIDASLQKVVGLHHAGSNRDAVNYAIPMSDILAESKILKAAAVPQPEPTPTPTPTPGTGKDVVIVPPDPGVDESALKMCDALYDEAKDYAQCFAYEAYLQVCGDHTYSILAKSYIARECNDVVDGGGNGGGGDMGIVTPAPTPTPTPVPTPTPAPVENKNLRPWCSSSNLNTTERTICSDRYIAGLDEEMEKAYAAPARAVSRTEQFQWLQGTRNRCGADTGCLARVYIERISYLKTPDTTTPPDTGHSFPMYVTGTDHLNVRSGPGTQYGVINRIDFGDKVTVLRNSDGWNNVRLSNGQNGWVSGRYLASSKPTQKPVTQCTATVINLKRYSSRTRNDGSGFLNIRTQASTRGRIISETYLGDTLKVLNQSGSWAQVQCISGQCRNPYKGTGGVTGWASKRYLSIRCQ